MSSTSSTNSSSSTPSSSNSTTTTPTTTTNTADDNVNDNNSGSGGSSSSRKRSGSILFSFSSSSSSKMDAREDLAHFKQQMKNSQNHEKNQQSSNSGNGHVGVFQDGFEAEFGQLAVLDDCMKRSGGVYQSAHANIAKNRFKNVLPSMLLPFFFVVR